MGAKTRLSASQWALEQLESGRAITHPDAIMSGHGWRLAARIYDLRKAGFQIITRRDRRGAGVYSLPDERQLDFFGDGAVGSGAGDASSETDQEADHDR
ncbi:helix-turn-helix domain-containing protein [Acidithiobacillus sp.]|uniref:helix-turn-helix domain-containing protein n=1 Tax=Acidithiobacillus sp. TaxID=1872118 RepID=UPI003CFE31F9